jgi:hypothetical protein
MIVFTVQGAEDWLAVYVTNRITSLMSGRRRERLVRGDFIEDGDWHEILRNLKTTQ